MSKSEYHSKQKISFISALKIGWKLAAKCYEKDRLSYIKKQQRKIAFHICLAPLFAKNWMQLIHSEEFSKILTFRPRIYSKPFRVYISTKWNKNQRKKVILDSYRFLDKLGLNWEDVLSKENGKLITEVQSDGLCGKITLGYDHKYRKEGEFVLFLESEELGGVIAAVAFSMEEIIKGQWSCLIGSVQIHNRDKETAFKTLQKQLHGLRPHSFLVYSLQEICRGWECQTILATGDKIQAYRKKHAIHLPGMHSIAFNYNQFWEEVGGKDLDNGWFQIPLTPVLKDIKEVKSKKRSMYNKRYELLDRVFESIATELKK